MSTNAHRTGLAHLPLHGGHAPAWLFQRMARLAREITAAIVLDFGVDEMLRRLADPFWFQAFGCVLGYDWHSSGVTTTVCGALKAGLSGTEHDIGLFLAGKAARAMALIADIVYGAPTSFRDPATYSFAHGGKDGHPFLVDRALYDRSIELLSSAVRCARLREDEKREALIRLRTSSRASPRRAV